MNYLLYGRVSTTRQAERELSIPAQIKACEKYAVEHSWKALPDNIFEERGESARTADRPQLQKMLHRAKTDSEVDVILVHKLDRLCRNVADYAAIKMMLKKQDVRVISVVEQFDESFSGELVEHIMASIAQWTSQNISWEVKKGLKEAVERGCFPGVAPLGYLNDKKSKLLIIDRLRARYVRLAFELYATGKYGFESLAEYLNGRGFRTRGGKLVGRRTIEHVLNNPIYYGLIKTVYGTSKANFPALITQKLFDDVQEMIKQRNKFTDRSRKHLYPLSAFMRCSECDSVIVGEVQRGHLYYRCTHRKNRDCPVRKCLKAEDVDAQVKAHLARVHLPDKMKKALDKYFERFVKGRLATEERERKSIKQELSRIQEQIKNLAVDRAKRIIEAETFMKVQGDQLREKETLQKRLNVLETKSDLFIKKLNDLILFSERADVFWDKAPIQQKHTILKIFIEGFTVENQKLVPIWTPVFDVLIDLQNS